MGKTGLKILMFCLFCTFAIHGVVFAGGVTIITHGYLFGFGSEDYPDWIDYMATEVADRIEDKHSGAEISLGHITFNRISALTYDYSY